MMQNRFKKNRQNPFDRRSNVKSGETGHAVSGKKTFEDYEILYMYIDQGQGQMSLGDKNLIATKRVCYFDHTL